MRANLLPRLNISETDSKYFIEAELPGVKQNDVELKLDNNILIIKGNAEENVKEFDTGQKPVALMKLLLQLGAPGSNDTVLDFFAGSGSTADALMQLNSDDGASRRFVLVQIPEPVAPQSLAGLAGLSTIADLTRSRIRRSGERLTVSQGILGGNLDVGYRSYKLADTNFSKWKASSSSDADGLEQQHLDTWQERDRRTLLGNITALLQENVN
jgi:hypothetical protein